MKSVTMTCLTAAWGMLLCLTPAVADQAADKQAADEQAIREAVAAYVAAYNRGDAAAVAAMWSPDAVYTNPLSGEQVVGREAVEKQFATIFSESKGAKLIAETNSVQFVSPNVAIEKGTATVQQGDDLADATEYSAVYIKRDGKWLLDRVTETDPPPGDSPGAEQLKQLDWMIGLWVDADQQATVTTKCQWTKNHNFMLRMFSVAAEDQVDFAGLQIIGWDPAKQQIRSWVFDSDGGFGTGEWTQKGDAWHIKATGTAADGSKSSAVNILSYLDPNTFTWQSVNRVVAGELLPNVDEVVVRRQDSQP